MSTKLTAIIASVCLATCSALALTSAAAAESSDAKDVKALNAKVGKPLQEAMKAAKSRQFNEALDKIAEAEKEKKTAYEQFKINETEAYVYYAQKDYAKLAAVYEKMLKMPQFLSPQSPINTKTIAQLYASIRQTGKTIDYSKQWLEDHPGDLDVRQLLGQSYYVVHDYRACKDTMSGVVAAMDKGGGKASENALVLLRSCADSAGDSAAAGEALEQLCRYYPKPEVWQAYIRANSRTNSDLAAFQWFRLMNDVGVLRTADDYSTYAQQAMLSYGSPDEALRVVEQGFNKQVLGSDPNNKVRHDTLLTKAKEAAKASDTNISKLADEAEQDPTGEKSAELGFAYFGAEKYDQASNYLEKAIKKGGLKDLPNVKLTLGIAELKKGQRDAARSLFRAVSHDDVLGKVAAAWILRSYN